MGLLADFLKRKRLMPVHTACHSLRYWIALVSLALLRTPETVRGVADATQLQRLVSHCWIGLCLVLNSFSSSALRCSWAGSDTAVPANDRDGRSTEAAHENAT